MTAPDEVTVRTPDGRALHTRQSGPVDRPVTDVAIVFEAGLGSSGATWGLVQEITSRTVRSVSYDRAGYGASDPATDSRGVVELADDLGVVLDSLDERAVVLVGHSWGGPVVRELAGRERHRERVAALVLVDPSDEASSLYFSWMFAANSAVQGALRPLLAHTGMLRRTWRTLLSPLPEPWLSDAVSAVTTPTAVRTARAEDRQLVPSMRALLQSPPELGDLPVRVLSGQSAQGLERRIRPSLVAAHEARAAASPNGRLVPAPASSHMILLTEPELVAAQALELAAG